MARRSRASAAMRMCGRSAPRSCMFLPGCGLMAYGRKRTTTARNGRCSMLTPTGLSIPPANTTDVWFVKAGIKRTWTPLGATVIWGEGGQYENMFNQFCGQPGAVHGQGCVAPIATGGTTSFEGFNGFPNVTLAESPARLSTAMAPASCRRSTPQPCISGLTGSTSISTSTRSVWACAAPHGPDIETVSGILLRSSLPLSYLEEPTTRMNLRGGSVATIGSINDD